MPLQPISGLLKLVRMPAQALPEFIVQTHANPDLAQLCMQMFYALLALGERDFALDMQARALKLQRLYRLAGPELPAIRLLALMAPGDMLDNTPIEFLIEHSDIQLDLLYLLPDQALPTDIPEHDVLMVAIGESDKNRPLLLQAQTLLAAWPRPVLNPAHAILNCARDVAYQLLHDIPGLVMPMTQRLKREDIREQRFPCTIRPVDTQGGTGLEKIDTPSVLDAYFERFSHSTYFVADYVDYQNDDGLFRKLRIVLISGEPFICHVAISDHWMVHYLSAGMELSESKRAEEAALMKNFEHGFALRHAAALRDIALRLDLDYVVLDCAETADTRLLLFEVDSRAWIHSTDDVEIFPYKPAVMQKAYDAFRALLWQRMVAP
jgi:glutathione synthase/RimK-type ligase-like ATP-grasp enzyme